MRSVGYCLTIQSEYVVVDDKAACITLKQQVIMIIMPLALVLYTLLLGSSVGGVAAFSSPSLFNKVVTRHYHVSSSTSVSSSTTLWAVDNVQQVDRRTFAKSMAASISTVTAASAGALLSSSSQPALAADDDNSSTNTIDPSIDLPKITNKVYLDIKFGQYKTKRLVIGLFGDVMPNTVANFLSLCTNSDDGNSYAGTTFYRVISDMTIQGGAIGSSSGKSSSSPTLQPDNYSIRHTKAGLVSAVRNKDGSIDSRFFINTEQDAGWADDRYASFGIVLEDDGSAGMDLVKKISKVDVKTPQNSPKDPVMIVGCGVLEV